MINGITKLVGIFLILFLFCGCKINKTDKMNFNDYVTIVNNYLLEALNKKKDGLITYLTDMRELSEVAKSDKVLTSFFKAKNDYYQLRKDSIDIPEIFEKSISSLKTKINQHYLEKYLNFYDILFINVDGDIFYTIRKESDYHTNINDSLFVNTTFAKKLLEKPDKSFVDFQLYNATGMPSAFFIEPFVENGKRLGWIVMQLSVDKINHMFVDNNIGQTGEIVLVNKKHFLLTSSRFSPNETILKQKLPDKNIIQKFKEKKGAKQVVDYRGKEVVSVFEVFDFMDNEWLIIAKKDKAELVTEYYKKNKELLIDKIRTEIQKSSKLNNISSFIPPRINSSSINTVLIDEFKKADSATFLFTQGVSTCTSLCITYSNRFAYMAHISPYDEIYNENRSDLINTVLSKIEYFEIPDHEKSEIKVYVTITDLSLLENILTKLVNKKYYLNQIRIFYLENVDYANLYCSSNKQSWVVWNFENTACLTENLNSRLSIQELIIN